MTVIDKTLLIFLPISHLAIPLAWIITYIFNGIFPGRLCVIGGLLFLLIMLICCIVTSIKIIWGLGGFEPEKLARTKLFRYAVILCPIAFLSSMAVPSEKLIILSGIYAYLNGEAINLGVAQLVYLAMCTAATVIAAFAVCKRPGKAAIQSFIFSWLWSGPVGIGCFIILGYFCDRPLITTFGDGSSVIFPVRRAAYPYILWGITITLSGIFALLYKKTSPKHNRSTD